MLGQSHFRLATYAVRAGTAIAPRAPSVARAVLARGPSAPLSSLTRALTPLDRLARSPAPALTLRARVFSMRASQPLQADALHPASDSAPPMEPVASGRRVRGSLWVAYTSPLAVRVARWRARILNDNISAVVAGQLPSQGLTIDTPVQAPATSLQTTADALLHVPISQSAALEPARDAPADGAEEDTTIVGVTCTPTRLRVLPRPLEGGFYLQFECAVALDRPELSPPTHWLRATAAQLLSAAVTSRLGGAGEVTAYQVAGTPFLEDIVDSSVSKRVDVTLKHAQNRAPVELTTEIVFEMFRPFGRIESLEIEPLPARDARSALRAHASVTFERLDSAIAARNCMHRSSKDVAKERVVVDVRFEPVYEASKLIQAAHDHPNLAIALLILVLVGVMYVMFDPIRVFTVQHRIRYGGSTENLSLVDRVILAITNMAQMTGGSSRRESLPQLTARESECAALQSWLSVPPERILVVTGPKGSGKGSMIESVIKGRRNVVRINVGPLLESSQEGFIRGLCREFGVLPGFAIPNLFSLVVNVVSQSGEATATSSWSTKTSAQVAKILDCVRFALINLKKELPSAHYNYAGLETAVRQAELLVDEKTAEEVEGRGVLDRLLGRPRPAESKGDFPDDLPLFIVEGFTMDNKEKGDQFLDKFLDWAGLVTDRDLARVLFITDQFHTIEEGMAGVYNEVKVSSIVLNDASVPRSLDYVQQCLQRAPEFTAPLVTVYRRGAPGPDGNAGNWSPATAYELSRDTLEAIHAVGGRFRDLWQLVRSALFSRQAAELTDDRVEEAPEEAKKKEDKEEGSKEEKEPEDDTKDSELFSDSSSFARNRMEELVRDAGRQTRKALFIEEDDAPPPADGSPPPPWTRSQFWSVIVRLALQYDELDKAARDKVEQAAVELYGGKCFTKTKGESLPVCIRENHAGPGGPNVPCRPTPTQCFYLYGEYMPPVSLDYDDVLFNIFKGDNTALMGLVRSDLLRVHYKNGKPIQLRAASPVMLVAFHRLAHDERFHMGMDVMFCRQMIAKERRKIKLLEDELLRIHKSTRGMRYEPELAERRQAIVSKVGEIGRKLVDWQQAKDDNEDGCKDTQHKFEDKFAHWH